MQLRRLFVSAVLSLISILISPVLSTDALWNTVLAETTSGTPTAMPASGRFARWGSYASGGNTYVIALSTTPSALGDAYFFFGHYKGSPVASTSIGKGKSQASGALAPESVVLTEAKTMYAGGVTGTVVSLQIHTMSYDTTSGLYTQNSWTTNSGGSSVTMLIAEAGTTNYLYYLTNTKTLGKWNPTVSITSALLFQAFNGDSSTTQLYDANTIPIFGTQTPAKMEFVDKTTMTISRTLTGPRISVTFTVDNLNVKNLFNIMSGSPYAFSKMDISGTSTMTELGVISGTSDLNSNILNFGPYQYIGLVRVDLSNQFQMYDKIAFTQAVGTVFSSSTASSYSVKSLVQGPSEGNKFFLAYALSGLGYNFQSYYIQFDLCSSRPGGAGTANAICPSCPTGYYLSAVGVANNECYPEGWGINIAAAALMACTAANCKSCALSNTICKGCYTGFNLNSFGAGSCDKTSTSSSGSGKTPTTPTNPSSTPAQIVINNLDQGGSWDPDTLTIRVYFSFKVQYSPNFTNFLTQIRIINKTDDTVYTVNQLNGRVVDQTDHGFGIRLPNEQTFMTAELVMDKQTTVTIADSQTGKPFDQYPIYVPGIYSFPTPLLLDIATATIEAVSKARFAATLLLISSDPKASIFLDYLFSELFILKQYEGEFLVYPEIILRTSAESSLLPFEIPNIYETEDDGDCIPASLRLQGNEITCVALNNYGEDATTITFILGLAALVSLTNYLLTRYYSPKLKEPQKSWILKKASWINVSYGLKFFHAKMEGDKLEVVFHMLLGTLYRTQNFKSTINIIFVFLTQTYYWVLTVIAMLFASEVGRFLTRSPAILILLKAHNKAYLEKLEKVEKEINDVSVLKGIATRKSASKQTKNLQIPKGSILKNGKNLVSQKAEGKVDNPKQEPISKGGEFKSLEYEIPGKEPDNRQAENLEMYSLPPVPSEEPHLDLQALSKSVRFLRPDGRSDQSELKTLLDFQKAKLASLLPERKIFVESATAENLRFYRQLLANPKNLINEAFSDQFYKVSRSLAQAHQSELEPPEPYLPEAGELLELDEDELAQVSFFVEDNSIPTNTAYRFEHLATLIRSVLLSLVLIRVTGQPATQIFLGLIIELALLTYMKLSHCKASKKEYYVELSMQILRVIYLLFKLVSNFDVMSTLDKQYYLGIPMAVFLSLICLINIIFMIYTIVEFFIEVIEVCKLKLREFKMQKKVAEDKDTLPTPTTQRLQTD